MGFSIDRFFISTLPRQLIKKQHDFTLIGATVTLILILLHNLFTDGHFIIAGHAFADYIDVCLVLLCSTICGSAAAFILTIVIFVVNSIVNTAFAYTPSVMLLTTLLSSIPVSLGWYRSKQKTLLAAVIFSLATGALWCIMLAAIEERRFTLLKCVGSFCNAFFPMVITTTLCYLFFTFAPECLKLQSTNGMYYSHCYCDFNETVTCSVKSRLSMKVTCIVVFEAVILSLAAVLFSNLLLPKLNEDAFAFLYAKRFIEFMRNRSTIAFDLKMFLLMMNVTVPLCVLVNHIGQNSVAYPIRLMAKAMRDFTTNTTKEDQKSMLNIHLLPIHNKDEIGDLYQSLRTTARQLTCYIERLEHEKQLEIDLAEAKAASKAKTAFLSNMSHEIRTPINAVLGLNEMILRESADPAVLGYAADIKSASNSLLSIVNDILDFSKIEAGKMEIIPVQYELSSLINDLVNMIQKRAEDKGLALNINVAKDMPHLLFGDDVRIKQVLLNILTNAVKYTNEGSVTMTIGWRKADDGHIMLTASVADTGIGIKQEDISKLFSAFERIEEKRNRSIEGTGLGMNIVQQLLSMMGSQLQVESEYGKGSTFSFEVQQKVQNWEPIGDFTEMYKKSIATNARYTESFHAPEAKILIVDDTKLNLTVIKGLLKQTKIQIDTAESGQETLVLVKKNRYDAIFIDHRMPIMDGIETLNAMRGMEGNLNEGVPCIALTANAIQGAREMYLEAGFTDYLSKPVDGEKLEKMLAHYLPQEKLVPVSQEEAAALSAAGITAEEASAAFDGAEDFPPLEGVDIAVALKNCGDADILHEAMQEFYDTIEEKAAQIEQFARDGDWKNYTVLVHALKSSARLIGAAELSRQALHLEESGNAAGSNKAEAQAEIAEKTPALLSLYRSYLEKLSPLCSAAAEDDSKPLISDGELSEALIALKEFVSAFDYDSADQIMQMLDTYRMPDAEREKVQAAKKALAAVDRETLLKLL